MPIRTRSKDPIVQAGARIGVRFHKIAGQYFTRNVRALAKESGCSKSLVHKIIDEMATEEDAGAYLWDLFTQLARREGHHGEDARVYIRGMFEAMAARYEAREAATG